MSYLDYRKLPDKAFKVSLLVVFLTGIFLAGTYCGKIVQDIADKEKVGTVIEKEHLPEKVIDGERYEEEYFIVVKDRYGDMLRFRVSEGEYRQVDVNERYRMK